jgi:molybdopterin synthase catalytic subunit
MTFRITSEVIDPDTLKRDLADRRAGAFVAFEGWVRDHNEGEAVNALDYESHAEIAEKEGERIIAEAMQKFDVLAAHCRHRVGELAIGDCAVWVGVSAAHRGAAFEAARYIIDEVKQRVPIWKKEHYQAGHSGWVNCATGAS